MNNFVVIILDGVGIGECPDSYKYSDEGSNTLSNMADFIGGLNLPNLEKLGLGNIHPIKGINPVKKPLASFGKMQETAVGKDSTSGHWEISGLNVDMDFAYYPNGFPKKIIDEFIELTGVGGVLGNKSASGTEIIAELGDEHVRTKFPIVYTSADSVFQIAAHEDVIPLGMLYEICTIARNEIFVGKDSVGRVIARPFVGTTGNYTRTTNRRDFSLFPPKDTILDYIQKEGLETIAIGKINDLFAHRGITLGIKTKSNLEGIEQILKNTAKKQKSFIFANLVDFDVYYGHRNDPVGFAKALEEFDEYLPKILENLDETDALIITADHGNDPTTPSTDHSREFVPILFYRKGKNGINLGTRQTFADVAQTIAHFYKINNDLNGISFLYG